MATLDQLYRAYLNEDPNVSQMNYDPFGWNYEQTFDTTEEDTDTGTDTGVGAVVSPTTTGGDNYSVYNPDPNKVRLPSSFQRTEGSWQGPGTTGLPGDILQRGPGRQLDQFEYKGKMYDDPLAPASLMDDEDASWFKQFREGLIDNPLMQGVMSAVSPAMNALKGLAQKLPVNERAILENQALGSGVALDDIGRVVQQQGLDYDTAENIMAGYNYAQMDEDTFDDRIANLKMKEGPAKEARIKAIEAAKKAWLESKRKSNIVTQKQRLDRADDDQKATIKEFKTKENILQDDPSLHTFKTTPKDDKPKAPPSKPKVTTPFHPSQGGQNQGAGGGQTAAPGGTGKGSSYSRGDYGGRGHHWAEGGLIRRPYGKGGIVDLL